MEVKLAENKFKNLSKEFDNFSLWNVVGGIIAFEARLNKFKSFILGLDFIGNYFYNYLRNDSFNYYFLRIQW